MRRGGTARGRCATADRCSVRTRGGAPGPLKRASGAAGPRGKAVAVGRAGVGRKRDRRARSAALCPGGGAPGAAPAERSARRPHRTPIGRAPPKAPPPSARSAVAIGHGRTAGSAPTRPAYTPESRAPGAGEGARRGGGVVWHRLGSGRALIGGAGQRPLPRAAGGAGRGGRG